MFGVSNVQMYGGYVVHIGSFEGKTGRLSVGDKVICKVTFSVTQPQSYTYHSIRFIHAY